MKYKEGVGVILPKREFPYIYDGKEQPRVIKSVFVTPDGYFPRMVDIGEVFGRSRKEVEARRIKHTGAKFTAWYKIDRPTVEDVEKALENVNRLYRWTNIHSDHCDTCNALDEALFKEKCWLVSCSHDCDNPKTQGAECIEFTYSYGGNDYTLTLEDFFKGSKPHLMETTDEES